jgi:hypothetical protein
MKSYRPVVNSQLHGKGLYYYLYNVVNLMYLPMIPVYVAGIIKIHITF